MTNKSSHDLQAVCQALLQADPDIVEIIQFGSSVYAPDLAHDVDLVVMTRAKKDNVVYWDALLDHDVDLVVREPGQSVGHDVALSIRAWSRSLYGDDRTREEVIGYMTIPTYEEARGLLTSRMSTRPWPSSHGMTSPVTSITGPLSTLCSMRPATRR